MLLLQALFQLLLPPAFVLLAVTSRGERQLLHSSSFLRHYFLYLFLSSYSFSKAPVAVAVAMVVAVVAVAKTATATATQQQKYNNTATRVQPTRQQFI